MTTNSNNLISRLHPRTRIPLLLILMVLVFYSVDRLTRQEGEPETYVQLHGQTMGTTWSAKVTTPTVPPGTAPGYAIQRAVNQVDSLMSTYKPNSELMRFNRNLSTDPISISEDLTKVFVVALEVGAKSGGALDVTVWPLVELWGFGAADYSGRAPSPDTLAVVAERVGYNLLKVDPHGGTLQKNRGDVYCDLSAVAKGYGVDMACESLIAAGYESFLMEIGGEMRSRGKHPTGRPWTIAVEKPDPDRRVATISIPLEDLAAATSGSYRNFVEQEGKRQSHILDPRTLAPVDHGLVSVTVLHTDTATADAWATALMVMGSELGFDAAQKEGLAAYFITEEPDGSLSSTWTDPWPQ